MGDNRVMTEQITLYDIALKMSKNIFPEYSLEAQEKAARMLEADMLATDRPISVKEAEERLAAIRKAISE